MAKEKTEKSKYFSKNAGAYVTAAQYITEMVCENLARKKNKPLGAKFWNNKEWAKTYRDQIASANKLLKKYSPFSLISALRDQRARSIYSLRAPHLIPIVEQYSKLEVPVEPIQEVEKQEIDRVAPKKFHVKSPLEEL